MKETLCACVRVCIPHEEKLTSFLLLYFLKEKDISKFSRLQSESKSKELFTPSESERESKKDQSTNVKIKE